MQSEAAAASVASVAMAWDIGDVAEARAPDAGTVNQTVLLTTSRGRFVLRGYRHHDREPVEREHAVIAHVRARGLPAVAPLPLPGGHTIHESDGRFYALLPWAAGQQVPRAAIGAREAAAMGAFLARLHRALCDFPTDRLPIPRRSYAFAKPATLARIDELAETVRAGAAADPLAPTVLTRLAGQRAHVEALPDAPRLDVGGLAEQVIHGDYQEANLFFTDHDPAGGCSVSAVIDWDQTYLAPRAREVMRTLDLVFGFEPTKCWHFLRAYRAEQPLPLPELDVAAAAYDMLTSHSLWVYEALYVEGNRRVARFLEGSGAYVPVMERWQRVRCACAPDSSGAS
jgi:Ser/Thr protein kinase RdoA (MazF antagonist)